MDEQGWRQRRPTRARGYDYRQAGMYFITICTWNRRAILADIHADGAVRHTRIGEIVSNTWHHLPQRFRHVSLDAFVVLPDHVHGIVVLHHRPLTVAERLETDGSMPGNHEILSDAPERPVQLPHNMSLAGLSEVIGAFKSDASRRAMNVTGRRDAPLWQRSFYDQIIRSEQHLDVVRAYILDNPVNWAEQRPPPSPPRRS